MSVLRWIYKKIKRHIPLLIVVTLLFMAVAWLGVQLALETKALLEVVQKNMGTVSAGGLPALFQGDFLAAAIRLSAVVLTLIVLRFLARHLQETLNISLERDLKAMLLHKLMHGNYSTVSAYHSGELVNRLSNDVTTVDTGLVNVLPGLAQMLMRLVAAAVALFILEPWMTLVILAIGVLIAMITGSFRKHLKNLHKQVSASNGRVNAFIQETLEKLLIVQGMDVADEMDRRAGLVLEDRRKIQNKQKKYSILGHTGLSIAMQILYYGALIYSAARLMSGAITFGTLTAISQLVGQVEGPLANLSSLIHQYIAMKGSAERLMDLDALPSEEDRVEDGNALYEALSSIRGRGVCFSYPGDEDAVLQDLDFEVKKGSFAAITGPSGSGKSTLLKLMLGIYSPDQGVIELQTADGNARVLSRGARSLFSYVPQGNLLLSGTLRENLLLARPDADDEALLRALQIADLIDFVAEQPEGLDTLLSESGSGISEGQAQRLSIARALLRDAPVLLLDEATSALDAATEERVLTRIKALSGKTVIVVTHRPFAETLSDCRIKF